MQSDDLDRRQIAIIRRRIAESAEYLHRLRQRMDANRFPGMDPLRVDVIAALGRMKCLLSELDYLTMKLGGSKPQGRTARDQREDLSDIF